MRQSAELAPHGGPGGPDHPEAGCGFAEQVAVGIVPPLLAQGCGAFEGEGERAPDLLRLGGEFGDPGAGMRGTEARGAETRERSWAAK